VELQPAERRGGVVALLEHQEVDRRMMAKVSPGCRRRPLPQ
jgi:hypothetical protein